MIGREPYECTCGDPVCPDCNPLGPDETQRDLNEALDVLLALRRARTYHATRDAGSRSLKLLMKHGRIKELT